MEPEFWLSRWREGRTGFHREEVHPDLVQFESTFLADGPHRVLVPLCGSTLDLAWLAGRGHEVVGVELSPQAVATVFETAGLSATQDTLGPFLRSRSGRLTVLQGDVFEATLALVGAVDRVWDRAAIVALDPPQRVRYTAVIDRLLRPGGLLLQNGFRYDQSKMDGPPFSVPEEELARHYATWSRELLLEEVLTEGKYADLGIGKFEVARYLLAKPG